MKLHLAFLSAFASLAAAAVAGNSRDIAPPFTEEPGGVEKRDNIESPPSSMWSMQCNNVCERDVNCCLEDKCSGDKRCEGYWSETFPFGYPLHEAVNYSDPADVEKWSRLSNIRARPPLRIRSPTPPVGKRGDEKDLSPADSEYYKSTGLWFSRACGRSCEGDFGCCISDTCSKDKKCEGFFQENFPFGYPLRQKVNWSDSTEVKKWSKLSMDEHLAHSPSASPGKRDDVKDSTFPKNERSYSAAFGEN
ncbi:hypothetical protein COH20_007138 [Aspergillus flavus]|nr:hypothetical protein COH20_007138 [Aspergillus flavus]RAQ79930.1 hypothetical protein COH21_012477 [Aspergillus flavus]